MKYDTKGMDILGRRIERRKVSFLWSADPKHLGIFLVE